MRYGVGMRLSTRLRQARRADDGFTLVELIVTVAIVGFIVFSLTGIVIVHLKTTVATQARITESQDVQFAAAYWQRDVASIGVRAYDSGTKTFPLQQSVDITPACALPAGTPVATLAWSQYTSLDSTATPVTVSVSYVAAADGSGYDLLRVRCVGSSESSRVVVAKSLNALPVKTCDVTCTNSGANLPRIVELQLSVLDPDGNGTTAYTATLTGERRQT